MWGIQLTMDVLFRYAQSYETVAMKCGWVGEGEGKGGWRGRGGRKGRRREKEISRSRRRKADLLRLTFSLSNSRSLSCYVWWLKQRFLSSWENYNHNMRLKVVTSLNYFLICALYMDQWYPLLTVTDFICVNWTWGG